MLNGKVALVTGGSRGIGAAVAKKLASLGADIAVVYGGNTEKAERICEEIRASYGVKAQCYACNVADFAEVKQKIKHNQRITKMQALMVLRLSQMKMSMTFRFKL